MITPDVYQAIVIKHAIKLYATAGIKANSSYTPGNMLRTAGRITGKSFKRGQYQQAIAALDDWIKQQHDAAEIASQTIV